MSQEKIMRPEMAGSSNVRISVHPAVGFDHQVASPAEYVSLAMETTHNHEQLTSAEFMQATGLHSMPWSSKACGIGAATVTSGCECWYSSPTRPPPPTPACYARHHTPQYAMEKEGLWRLGHHGLCKGTAGLYRRSTTHEYFTGSCLPFMEIRLVCKRFSILCLYIHTYYHVPRAVCQTPHTTVYHR